MSKKKNKTHKHENDETAVIVTFTDDQGLVIDDINDFMNQPDEDLQKLREEELDCIEMMNAKLKFMQKLKKYNHLGIGVYLKLENLDEFTEWVLAHLSSRVFEIRN